MTTMSVCVRRAAGFAVLAVAALAALLLPAAPASAHAVLTRTAPAAEAVVQQAPTEVTLTFSEGVRLVPDKIRVIAPDGKRVDVGDPVVTGGTVTVTLRPGGARGTYLVSYRVISADSHPVAGGFTYSVGAPSDTAPTVDADEIDPFVASALPVAKYLGYAGLVLLIGPLLVLAFLWPSRLPRALPGRLVWTGFTLVVASTIAGVLLQAPYASGIALTDLTGADLREVFGSPFGTAHVVRLFALAAAALLLPQLLRGRGGVADRAILGVLGVVALVTWPLSGHPAGTPVPAVSVVIDAVHLASAAVWLGGLVMLFGFLLRWADEGELGAILPVWSRWAATAVGALALAGVTQAVIEVASPGALVGTAYGRLIIAKAVLFAAVLGVAAYARRLILRGAAAGRPGTMRRAVAVELGVATVILILTAVLVQTTPARTAEASDATPAGPVTTVVTSSLYKLEVQVEPATVGRNNVHLYAYTPAGKPLRVVEWQARAALPAAGVEPIAVPLVRLTDNHATGSFSVPSAGSWQLRFTLRISDIDQATVTATVPIT
ncbi:MAG TPA: copper resistance protein CopC [Pilimelia sp.]|nr:copper resistance protein CopC [Pilimelia sp.]